MLCDLFAMPPLEVFKQIDDFDFDLFEIFISFLPRAIESSLSSNDDELENTLAVEKVPNEFRFGVLVTGCFELFENVDDDGVARGNNRFVGDADIVRYRRLFNDDIELYRDDEVQHPFVGDIEFVRRSCCCCSISCNTQPL